METKKITLVTYRTLDAVEIEVPVDTPCALCSNPAIGGMVFPEPYEIDENNLIQGNVVLCREHIDELTIDSKPL
jgi:hypothetical protein